MSIYGSWTSTTIASAGTTSAEVDLGREYEYLDIIIPTITSANISLQVSDKTGGTFQQLGDSNNYFAAGTGAISTTFNLYGWRYIKLVSSATQGATRTFYVRGYRG